ncbi:hypothetical protein C7M84_021027 [Penaeus vannamei]|uniref:Uncharacterized protein n=1 Tax=Penaeus vannamei TaxID=6689 RepID=A0A423SAM5_PENVA|nr:hypothetical protein C7M84_021027 [Penaeus vannamei]
MTFSHSPSPAPISNNKSPVSWKRFVGHLPVRASNRPRFLEEESAVAGVLHREEREGRTRVCRLGRDARKGQGSPSASPLKSRTHSRGAPGPCTALSSNYPCVRLSLRFLKGYHAPVPPNNVLCPRRRKRGHLTPPPPPTTLAWQDIKPFTRPPLLPTLARPTPTPTFPTTPNNRRDAAEKEHRPSPSPRESFVGANSDPIRKLSKTNESRSAVQGSSPAHKADTKPAPRRPFGGVARHKTTTNLTPQPPYNPTPATLPSPTPPTPAKQLPLHNPPQPTPTPPTTPPHNPTPQPSFPHSHNLPTSPTPQQPSLTTPTPTTSTHPHSRNPPSQPPTPSPHKPPPPTSRNPPYPHSHNSPTPQTPLRNLLTTPPPPQSLTIPHPVDPNGTTSRSFEYLAKPFLIVRIGRQSTSHFQNEL